MSFAKVYSAQITGLRGTIIDVEVDTARGIHAFAVVGLPDKAVEESKDRVSSAIKNSGFSSPKHSNKKIVISLAPADLRKEGPTFDLPIALAYLLAEKELSFEYKDKLFLGELSLEGNLRPIKGVLLLVQEAKIMGFKEVYVPRENSAEGALVSGIDVFGVSSLSEITKHLDKKSGIPSLTPEKQGIRIEPQLKKDVLFPDFSDIKGQESAKRALLVAAAGRHNIGLFGPPGTGKTMLARAFIHLLPELSFDEALEVTSIHSASGNLSGTTFIQTPPLRAPHHTSSYVSVVGGGVTPKPGEITLAHRGVLFLDEFPEFDRRVIEALRQPLEDKIINISRSKGTETFPASFMLIAAMNPCPCGNSGTKKECVCTSTKLLQYQRKISGPIIDRIDLWVRVGEIDHIKLSEERPLLGETAMLANKVKNARDIQAGRFRGTIKTTNSDMDARDMVRVSLSEDVQEVLNTSAKKLGLSPRAYHKIIKVARTIADLESARFILKEHVLEALQYRPKLEKIY